MYIPCRDVRIDDILEIRRCARKVGKLYNLNTDEEIVNYLFQTKGKHREKRSFKRKTFKLLQRPIGPVYFCGLLKESLIQDEYTYEGVTEDEMKEIYDWAQINGKNWKLAATIFHRPACMLGRIYKRYLKGTGVSIIRSLDLYCDIFRVLLKYYPNDVFDVKDMVVDPQCAGIRKLQKKAPGVSTQNFITIHHKWVLYGHRYWAYDEYEFFLDYILQNSRSFILDYLPCVVSLRFLSYPVNRLFHPLEYIFRLIYLYIYYIYEIPENYTLREYIHFLQEKLVVKKEEIPNFCFRLLGSQFRDVEFCGFVRGCSNNYVRHSKEMDEEIKWLNSIEDLPEDELRELIEKSNVNGCELRRCAEYSRLIPSEVEQSEEMLTEEQWRVKPKEKKVNKEYERLYAYLEKSSDDESTQPDLDREEKEEEGEGEGDVIDDSEESEDLEEDNSDMFDDEENEENEDEMDMMMALGQLNTIKQAIQQQSEEKNSQNTVSMKEEEKEGKLEKSHKHKHHKKEKKEKKEHKKKEKKEKHSKKSKK